MTADRIRELLAPFLAGPLAETQLAQISTYIDLLLRWNARINLTAIRNSEQIVTRHFGESFFLARHLFPSDEHTPRPEARGVRVLDIGSGAGFPGLPLKIWAPAISLTLVESNHKKAAFLRETARALTLTDMNVKTVRAESLSAPGPHSATGTNNDLQSYQGTDIVTMRAVERFDDMLPAASRLVHPGGRLAILIGASQLSALPTLTLNVQWAAPIAIPESQARVLSIGVRTG